MSQHFFKTTHKGEVITVMMGWDKPLQGFFMVIEDKTSGDDGFIYSNLEDPELAQSGGFAQSIEPFVNKLGELGIEVPIEMLECVEMDGIFNVGNKVVHYGMGTAMTSSNSPKLAFAYKLMKATEIACLNVSMGEKASNHYGEKYTKFEQIQDWLRGFVAGYLGDYARVGIPVTRRFFDYVLLLFKSKETKL